MLLLTIQSQRPGMGYWNCFWCLDRRWYLRCSSQPSCHTLSSRLQKNAVEKSTWLHDGSTPRRYRRHLDRLWVSTGCGHSETLTFRAWVGLHTLLNLIWLPFSIAFVGGCSNYRQVIYRYDPGKTSASASIFATYPVSWLRFCPSRGFDDLFFFVESELNNKFLCQNPHRSNFSPSVPLGILNSSEPPFSVDSSQLLPTRTITLLEKVWSPSRFGSSSLVSPSPGVGSLRLQSTRLETWDPESHSLSLAMALTAFGRNSTGGGSLV